MHEKVTQKRIRYELEGLRAVAAILVAVYHIWFNRVSGGVDVFFVVSGFLITTSLFSMYRRNGRILYFTYIVKLLKRLLPTAWLIGLSTFIVSLFIMPSFMKYQVLEEFLASIFYFQNWRLAMDSADYLAQNNSASPYQHFWALSIQFQFYLIWLVLFFVSIGIYKAIKKAEFKKIFISFMGLVMIASFSYSVYLTDVNQPFAYYHTFTRVWEFGIGGLLALTIHKISLSKPFAWVFGWVGLIALLSGGIIFQVSDVFPGYAALWPVLAAVLIIISGNQSKSFSAYRVLSWKPLVTFGGISYAFYLWHWPLLIFYFAYFEVETVSILGGLGIIVMATILAFITIYFVETPIRKTEISVWKTAAVISVLSLTVYLAAETYEQQFLSQEEISVSHKYDPDNSHPGATAKLFEGSLISSIDYSDPFLPSLDNAYQDRADIYPDRCLVGAGTTGVRICEYGETEDYTHTIALVGGSHSAHWQPMLKEVANNHSIRIVTYLKGGCRFSTETNTDLKECDEWFENVQEYLFEEKPDLIFTVGDVGMRIDEYDKVPPGFIAAWENFEEQNIPLFLVSDTPWYDKSVLRCINENSVNPEVCKEDRERVIRDPSPIEKLDTLPTNVTTMDVNDYFCDEEYCHYVIGNVITHFDNNHITATFARTLAPVMEDKILSALE